MKKLPKHVATALTITTLGLTSTLLISQPAQAQLWKNVQDSVKELDPTNKNSGIRQFGRDFDRELRNAGQQVDTGLRQLGGHLVEGLKSGVELCQEVGVQNCTNPNFLNTYVGIKQAANFGVFRGVEPCGQFVNQAVEMGSYGVQAYAAANGAAIPPEAMAIGQQQFRQYGALSCKVLYGRLPSTQPQGSIVNSGGQHGGQHSGGGITGEDHIRGIEIEQKNLNWRNKNEWETRERMNETEWDARERINETEWGTKDRMNERDNQTVRMGYDHEKEMLLLKMQNQHRNPWQNFNY